MRRIWDNGGPQRPLESKEVDIGSASQRVSLYLLPYNAPYADVRSV